MAFIVSVAGDLRVIWEARPDVSALVVGAAVKDGDSNHNCPRPYFPISVGSGQCLVWN